MIEYKTRPAKESDFNFIISTWLRSYRHASYFAKRITDKVYYKYQNEICKQLLSKAIVWVACDKEDENVIYAYTVIDPNSLCVHFMYTKSAFRQLGLAKSLINESKIPYKELQFSYWTKDSNWIIEKYPELTYNPYLGVL